MTFYFANFEFKDSVVNEICYLPSTLHWWIWSISSWFFLQTMIQFFDLIYPNFTLFILIVMMTFFIYLAHVWILSIPCLFFLHVDRTMIQLFALIYPNSTLFNLIVMTKIVIYLAHWWIWSISCLFFLHDDRTMIQFFGLPTTRRKKCLISAALWYP